MQVQESELVDGPIALSQVQQQAVRLLADQHLHKSQRMARHWPWQMSQSAMLAPDGADHPAPDLGIKIAHYTKSAGMMRGAGTSDMTTRML